MASGSSWLPSEAVEEVSRLMEEVLIWVLAESGSILVVGRE